MIESEPLRLPDEFYTPPAKLQAVGVEEWYRQTNYRGGVEIMLKGGGRREDYLVNEEDSEEVIVDILVEAWQRD